MATEPDEVGPQHLGELAVGELAAARHDPRLDRPAGTPIPDFRDAMAELNRARRAAIFSLHRVAGLDHPEDGSLDDRQALWEQTELARAERDGDFAWLNAVTLCGLHGALDALVEQNAPAVVNLLAQINVQEAVQSVAAADPVTTAQLPEGFLDQVVEAAVNIATEHFKVTKPRGNGSIRWEGSLGTVGLASPPDRPIPPAMDVALTEMCVLRDVLTHRGGRVDEKASGDWPGPSLEVGSFVHISQAQVQRYSAAVVAYGTEISRRLLIKFGAVADVDLSQWQMYGFLC